jgi:hypothetical protein
MGELEALDQALLLQLSQRALRLQLHGKRELMKRTLEVVEALFPADVLRHVGLLGVSGQLAL